MSSFSFEIESLLFLGCISSTGFMPINLMLHLSKTKSLFLFIYHKQIDNKSKIVAKKIAKNRTYNLSS